MLEPGLAPGQGPVPLPYRQCSVWHRTCSSLAITTQQIYPLQVTLLARIQHICPLLYQSQPFNKSHTIPLHTPSFPSLVPFIRHPKSIHHPSIYPSVEFGQGNATGIVEGCLFDYLNDPSPSNTASSFDANNELFSDTEVGRNDATDLRPINSPRLATS